ncbi:unnamed protein product [Prorocentrum cordatum]|uniref:Uncharacterized protein n=1 Tax=Prorocentrum cordatum TaxID=2364126 RepID=A0ABN9PEX3_9DINO|nr:unnamed protein product [Polarella glacialis]
MAAPSSGPLMATSISLGLPQFGLSVTFRPPATTLAPATTRSSAPVPTASSTTTLAPTATSSTIPSPNTSSTSAQSSIAATAPSRCLGRSSLLRGSCLADNDNGCCDRPAPRCDGHPQRKWCGASLAQSSRAAVQKHALPGLVQSSAQIWRPAPAAEEL